MSTEIMTEKPEITDELLRVWQIDLENSVGQFLPVKWVFDELRELRADREKLEKRAVEILTEADDPLFSDLIAEGLLHHEGCDVLGSLEFLAKRYAAGEKLRSLFHGASEKPERKMTAIISVCKHLGTMFIARGPDVRSDALHWFYESDLIDLILALLSETGQHNG